MSQSVKAYLLNNNHETVEIRRFIIESDVAKSCLYLCSKIEYGFYAFPSLNLRNFSLYWKGNTVIFVTV